MSPIIVSCEKQWKRAGPYVKTPELEFQAFYFFLSLSKPNNLVKPQLPPLKNKSNNAEQSTKMILRVSNEILLTKATYKIISCYVYINLKFNYYQSPYYPIYSFAEATCFLVFI